MRMEEEGKWPTRWTKYKFGKAPDSGLWSGGEDQLLHLHTDEKRSLLFIEENLWQGWWELYFGAKKNWSFDFMVSDLKLLRIQLSYRFLPLICACARKSLPLIFSSNDALKYRTKHFFRFLIYIKKNKYLISAYDKDKCHNKYYFFPFWHLERLVKLVFHSMSCPIFKLKVFKNPNKIDWHLTHIFKWQEKNYFHKYLYA